MKTISQTRQAVDREMKRTPGVARTPYDIQIAIGDDHTIDNINRSLWDNHTVKINTYYEMVARGSNYKSAWWRYTEAYNTQQQERHARSRAGMGL